MSNSNPDSAIEQSLTQINLKAITKGRTYYASPAAWDDEVLYFLLVDRFSDANEFNGFNDKNGNPIPQGTRTTDLFALTDSGNIDRNTWFDNGRNWCGGNLEGLREKLGYLKRLGITAVWISPIFKQTEGSNSYHGYGIQNFLDVEAHFGTRKELKDLITEAHQLGIRIILDIILNHAGNIFAYKNGNPEYENGQVYEVNGFKLNENDQQGSLPFKEIDLTLHPHAWPHGGVWPKEFQTAETWTQKGQIKQNQWDAYPAYLEGDFYSLKNINHGYSDSNLPEQEVLQHIKNFRRNKTLEYLGEVFKFWIAYADVDGYRIDTVKHMDPGAVRYFTNVIHEFAQSIGKENFYLIGEITGGRSKAINLVDATGLDAGLGIDDIQDKLEFLAKGWRNPGNPENDQQTGYFDLFNNSLVDGKNSHQWYAKRIITMFDDHDQVGTKHKFRYCGQGGAITSKSLPLALALNLTTLGIPCLYYGTEQAFNGADFRTGDEKEDYSDTFLRECMFGGQFGSFQSAGKHFFNESHEIYRYISQICLIRKQHIALRRGRQYLRQVSSTGQANDFYYPTMIGNELRWVVAWSRIFDSSELICAINTDLTTSLTIWVTVDTDLTPPDTPIECLFSTEITDIGKNVTATNTDERTVILITIPAAGFVIYSNNK
ncbi:alpha-amylase family glycosyl hydrolase [Adhaeribacter radiodurans]|uniref:Alpha-amylase n=1 Tax=Adhaeribacter radiodurans TaxID=2745197 RepID=A0A7L7L4Z7_9BACT|nr:alpha-amylase family glycosyl hydrolase [Adhaeribacter radiodurans]QMU27877.1 alpha-amylase [Adhaeribacter radiodurans]